MKCLVTGATGFIGRRLCQQLAARGDSIVALSRSGASLPDGTPTRALDLMSGDVPLDCLQGVDVVYHLAGIAHQRAEMADYQRLNVDASLQLARLAAAAGVRCFVFLSSVKAMGPAEDDRARDEQDTSTPESAYGLSKWRAECTLREEFSDDAMAVIILRPSLVYGAGAKGNLHLLARGVERGLPRPPDDGARSMVSLPDLVDLLCDLSQQQTPGVSTWIVAGGNDYSTREIYDALRDAAGKGRGIAWVPRWGWRLAAGLRDLFRETRGESTWEKLFGYERYSSRALMEATGWRARRTLQELAGGMLSATEPGAEN